MGSDFLAAELEGLLKARPSLSVPELSKWVKEEFGYTVSRAVMWDAKKEAITAIWGDSEKSFSVLPKFMASLCSSNKMRLEWQYDLLPGPQGGVVPFCVLGVSSVGRRVSLLQTCDHSGRS